MIQVFVVSGYNQHIHDQIINVFDRCSILSHKDCIKIEIED